MEYMESRAYQRYLFDNLLLQFDGKGISYIDYIKDIKVESKNNNVKTDYEKVKADNKKILEKFKKQGGDVE